MKIKQEAIIDLEIKLNTEERKFLLNILWFYIIRNGSFDNFPRQYTFAKNLHSIIAGV